MKATPNPIVVLVEDDPDVRDMVTTVLEQARYEVWATGDPGQVVEIVRRTRPDLILCDIAMPLMDGHAVVRALQAEPETRRFPVAFLTGRDDFKERVRAFRFGVVDYIAKPVEPDALIRRIETILAGLRDRPGTLEGRGEDGPILLDDVRRDGRTGIMTVGPEPGDPRVVIRGQVVGDTLAAVDATRIHFAELDPTHEDIVVQDGSAPPDAGHALPEFDDVPEALRDVLIADDQPLFRAALAAALVRSGLQVREAGDGRDALRQVQERPPALLVVDVRMPEMGGLDLCRRLRRQARTRHLPIMFLSGFDDFADRSAGLDAGGDDYLPKRTSLRELLLRVHLLLKRYSGGAAALRGRVELMGAPAAFHLCSVMMLTGRLSIHSAGQTVTLGFDAGRLRTADSDTAKGHEAAFQFVAIEHGTLDFEEGQVGMGTPVTASVEALTLEGCRRIDEWSPGLDRAQRGSQA